MGRSWFSRTQKLGKNIEVSSSDSNNPSNTKNSNHSGNSGNLVALNRSDQADISSSSNNPNEPSTPSYPNYSNNTGLDSVDSLAQKRRLLEPVLVADRVSEDTRRTEDLVSAGLCALGIVIVLVLSIYASATTLGMVEDVRTALNAMVQQLVFLPISVLEGLFVIVSPVWLIGTIIAQGRYRTAINALITLLITSLVGWIITLLLSHAPLYLSNSLFVVTATGTLSSVNVAYMVLAAMATLLGATQTMRSIRFTWYGIWSLLIFSVLRGTATLPGILVTVLFGLLFGLVARWIFGFGGRNAKAAELVKAVLDAGYTPKYIVRSDLATTSQPLGTWQVSEYPEALDYTTGHLNARLEATPLAANPQSFVVTRQPSNLADRHYRVWDVRGVAMDLHVIDPKNALIETLGNIWDNLRLRGMARTVSSNQKVHAEHSILAANLVLSSGVATSKPLGIANAEDSIVTLWQALPPTLPILHMERAGLYLSDAQLDQAWDQLEAAYKCGISHRDLDENNLAIDKQGDIWLLDWSQAELGGSEMAHRIDQAQLLVHFALAVGVERAVASALRTIGRAGLLLAGPFVQSAILPPRLRQRVRRQSVLDDLKEAIQKCAPSQIDAPELQPAKIQRFSVRTVALVCVGVFALVTVFGSLNFEDITAALAQANPWWILAAFLIGTLTWVGGAIPLVAFSPTQLRWKPTLLTQVASSVVTLVAPAGIGAAALNLRFLNRCKLSMPVAVSTVTLVQISQFLTSVALLAVIVAATGSSLTLDIPILTIMWVVLALITILCIALSVPKLRKWVFGLLRNYWQQIYPQLVWIIGHPRQLLLAFSGNMLMNIGYIGAFGLSVAAFGYTLNPMTLAITYLASNTLGSIIPSPGGIGPVEAALMGGLTLVGVPSAIALSASIVFRLVTFYGRVPFGWLALRQMEKRGLL